MQESPFTIRPMTLADLQHCLEWAAAEGWNPGVHDATCFYATDPGGFLVGEVAGEAMGCISAVRYGESFGFIGLYLVKPEWRGQGYGIRLWQAAMALLGDRIVGLDGVLAQVPNYAKSGFVAAHSHIRYRGSGIQGQADPSLIPLSELPFAEIRDYDTRHFPAPRPDFLRAWIENHRGLGIRVDGQLAGYGVIRACREGYKMGPLFADRPGLAEQLFLGLATGATGHPIFLDIPTANPAAIDFVNRYEMKPVFECVRMYTKPLTDSPLRSIFGVTSLELG